MKVEQMQTRAFWKGEVGVEGTVEDLGRRYRIRLEVRGSEICSCSCSCGRGGRCTDLCPHEKALFADYLARREEKPEKPVPTSLQVRKMIREYTDREVASIAEREKAIPVELTPRLLLRRQDIRAEFRVGRERPYVIKDLVAFAEAVEKETFVEYGKNLAFYHSRDAFSEDSRELLELVLDMVGSYREYYMEFKRNLYTSSPPPPIRELNFSHMRRERFLTLLEGRRVDAEDSQGRKRWLWIRREDPEIAVDVCRAASGGIRVSVDKEIATFSGEGRLCVLKGDSLYLCSEDLSRELEIFCRQMTQGYGAPYEVIVQEKDIPLFYERVLKRLEKLGFLRNDGVDLAKYRPPELKARFMLESPGPDQVVLRPSLSYGPYSFHPLRDKDLPPDICRDVPGEFKISQTLTKYFRYRDPETDDLVIRDDETALFHLLSEGIGELQALGDVLLADNMKGLRVLPPREVAVGIQASEDWLTLEVDAGGLNGAELKEILSAYREKRSYYRLKSGEFLRLEDNGLLAVARMVEGLDVPKRDLGGSTFKAPRYRAIYLDSLYGERGDVRLERNARFKSIVRGMRSAGNGDIEVPPEFSRVLRGYQKTGFCWLRTLDRFGFGGILADDMGLGKTVQVISVIWDERKRWEAGAAAEAACAVAGTASGRPCSLIVCPASLVYNWQCEFTKFAPSLRVLPVTGTAAEREEKLSSADGADVLITSYDLLKRDLPLYAARYFRFEIIDEAQYIKNPSTRSAGAVKAVRARTRYALTGTPVENRLSELWSIFDFLMPGFLYSYQRFRERFEAPIVREGDAGAMETLRRMTGPFILRRLKREVLTELPEKLESVVYSQMEGEQRKLYTARALQLKETLEGGGGDRIQILAALTRLRQICCDPRLIYEDYAGGSAKLETCMELVSSGVEAGCRILLFSQFTSMLELIRRRLAAAGIRCLTLTGETSGEDRQKRVEAFQRGGADVFLISLKAGGTGLNLTAADMVIHYDPWWNVAAQNQAADRAHRIGQDKTVHVIQLITKGTIEENILKLQKAKAALAEQVVAGEPVFLGSLSYEEIIKLLE